MSCDNLRFDQKVADLDLYTPLHFGMQPGKLDREGQVRSPFRVSPVEADGFRSIDRIGRESISPLSPRIAAQSPLPREDVLKALSDVEIALNILSSLPEKYQVRDEDGSLDLTKTLKKLTMSIIGKERALLTPEPSSPRLPGEAHATRRGSDAAVLDLFRDEAKN